MYIEYLKISVCVYIYKSAHTVYLICAESVCVQVQTDISVDTKQQTLQGVAFPLHGEAMQALQKFKDKTFNYVQLVSISSDPGLDTVQYILQIFQKSVAVLTVLVWKCSQCLEHECNAVALGLAGFNVENTKWNKIEV